MRSVREESKSIIMCVTEILIGILLLINPIGFTAGIIMGLGCLLVIAGIFSMMKYFKMDVREAALSQLLAKGLLEVLAGVFCILKTEWFLVTFPVLTMLYGLFILVTGLMKVQLTVDLLRVKHKRWYIAAINAVISVVCAVVILSSPFSTTSVLWMFTGASLIVEAIFDIITIVFKEKDKQGVS